MSSILDALRKVEREKAEVTQAVEVDFDEAAAERDLIGGTDGRGHMVLHLPPWVLMAFGGAFVLTVVAAAGLSWLWLRGPATEAPVAVVASLPKPVVAPAPKPEPPVVPARVETAPVEKKPEPEVVVAKAPEPEPPVTKPVEPEPPAQEIARVEAPVVEPAPTAPKEVLPVKAEEKPKPIAKALKERIEAEPDKAAVEEPKPQDKPLAEEVKPVEEAVAKPVEPEVEPKPEAVQLAKADTTPEPLPELPAPPPAAIPTIGEPLKSAPRQPEPLEAAAAAEPEKATEGAVLPPSEEDRRQIRLNMPRPANKRNPYASAIINLQPVFLNELIPGTTAKLVSVQEKGVIILKQDTGTRHFIPF